MTSQLLKIGIFVQLHPVIVGFEPQTFWKEKKVYKIKMLENLSYPFGPLMMLSPPILAFSV